MTRDHADALLAEIQTHFGRRYTQPQARIITGLMVEMGDRLGTLLVARVSEGEYLPSVSRWREARAKLLADQRRETSASAPDCPTCGGTGTTTAHALSLKDHRYLGEWTVRAPCGCTPTVAQVPADPEAIVRHLRRRGEEAVVFPSREELETWREAHPESIGGRVRC